MVVHSKLFTATDAINHEPFTMLIEVIDPIDGEPFVVIKALEGEYRTPEEFQDARKYSLQGLKKGYSDGRDRLLYRSISMMLPRSRLLVDALNDVLAAYEEG